MKFNFGRLASFLRGAPKSKGGYNVVQLRSLLDMPGATKATLKNAVQDVLDAELMGRVKTMEQAHRREDRGTLLSAAQHVEQFFDELGETEKWAIRHLVRAIMYELEKNPRTAAIDRSMYYSYVVAESKERGGPRVDDDALRALSSRDRWPLTYTPYVQLLTPEGRVAHLREELRALSIAKKIARTHDLPVAGDSLDLTSAEQRAVRKLKLDLLPKVWGYRAGEHGDHTDFEKDSHYCENGGCLQRVSDPLMRNLQQICAGGRCYDQDVDMGAAAEHYDRAARTQKVRELLAGFLRTKAPDGRTMRDIMEQLAQRDVTRESSHLMSVLVGSARSLLALAAGDRGGSRYAAALVPHERRLPVGHDGRSYFVVGRPLCWWSIKAVKALEDAGMSVQYADFGENGSQLHPSVREKIPLDHAQLPAILHPNGAYLGGYAELMRHLQALAEQERDESDDEFSGMRDRYVIVGKRGCSDCYGAIDRLEERDLPFTYLEHASRATLPTKVREGIPADFQTVPAIFWDGTFLGGYAELVRHLRERAEQKDDAGDSAMQDDDEPPYVVVGREGCPWCRRALELLDEHDLPIDYLELTSRAALPAKVRDRIPADFRTVPAIFLPDGKFLGGYNELERHLRN